MKKYIVFGFLNVCAITFSQSTIGAILPLNNTLSATSDTKTNMNSNSIESKRITYADHILAAQDHEVPLIENYLQLEELVASEKLIEVPKEGEGYVVMKLTHSKPFLTNKTKEVLEELSCKFYEETGSVLTISSMTRTSETQSKLRRTNKNAASNDSSHKYGASFDISYIRFNQKLGRNIYLENKLESLLSAMQDEGKLYFIKEHNQRCFHITAINIR